MILSKNLMEKTKLSKNIVTSFSFSFGIEPSSGIRIYKLTYNHEDRRRLTKAEMLHSDEEGIELRSCSLSISQCIMDDISPEAY